jgi:general secretion pathway protein C
MNNFIDTLKKYFWAINIILISLCAYLCSQIFTDYLRQRWRVVPQAPLSSAREVTEPQLSQKRDLSFYSVITERNIFNSRAKDMGAEAEMAELLGPVAESNLNVKLFGTVVSEFPELSFAVIEDSVSKQVEIYRLNDLILNEAEVVMIEPKRVIILRNGKQESLLVFEEEGAVIAAAPDSSAVREIRQVERNQYEIDRSEFEASTNNLAELMTQARVVPNLNAGKVDGYKIFAIKPDSLYAKIGLKNGDVIEKVNGMEITGPEQALELFQQLKTERYFQIDLLRRGRKETLTYTVR